MADQGSQEDQVKNELATQLRNWARTETEDNSRAHLMVAAADLIDELAYAESKLRELREVARDHVAWIDRAAKVMGIENDPASDTTVNRLRALLTNQETESR